MQVDSSPLVSQPPALGSGMNAGQRPIASNSRLRRLLGVNQTAPASVRATSAPTVVSANQQHPTQRPIIASTPGDCNNHLSADEFLTDVWQRLHASTTTSAPSKSTLTSYAVAPHHHPLADTDIEMYDGTIA